MLRTIAIKLALVVVLCASAFAQNKINLATQVTNTLGETNGGTGKFSYTKGDILCAVSSSSLTKLAVGSNGQVVTADSAQTCGVKWATPATVSRTCSVPLGSGSTAIVSADYTNFPEGCLISSSSTATQILFVGDAGASTILLADRSGNSNTNLTSSALTLATVSGITGRVVACANTGGTSITYQGQTVSCSALASTSLPALSNIVIAGGTADGTTKWAVAYVTF